MIFFMAFLISVGSLTSFLFWLSQRRHAAYITSTFEKIAQMMALGHFKAAYHALSEMTISPVYLEENLLLQAECLMALEEFSRAEDLYLQIVDLFPEDFNAYSALAYLFGVGLSQRMTHSQALEYASRALRLQPTLASWEILSACQARAGNFTTAHNILEQLSSHLSHTAGHETAQLRWREAMKILRRKMPLNEASISRSILVA